MKAKIRKSTPEDAPAIMALYPRAFPDEELRPVVRALLDDETIAISLVGVVENAVAGHVIFTFCGINDSGDHEGGDTSAALLAPLAVDPSVQRQGIGGALVQHGLRLLEEQNIPHVFVLGDPAYYGRFGFAPETQVAPPYPMAPEWREAWQSIRLNDADAPPQGKLAAPPPWRDPALWGP